jgi:hypothetical protein
MGNPLRTHRNCLDTIIRDHRTKSYERTDKKTFKFISVTSPIVNPMEVFNSVLLDFHLTKRYFTRHLYSKIYSEDKKCNIFVACCFDCVSGFVPAQDTQNLRLHIYYNKYINAE